MTTTRSSSDSEPTQPSVEVFLDRFAAHDGVLAEDLAHAQALCRDSQIIWEGGRIVFPHVTARPEVLSAIERAKKQHKVMVGFDRIKRHLADPTADKALALLVVVDSGSTRLYRSSEALVFKYRHLLPLRLRVSPEELARKLYGKDKDVKMLLVQGPDAVRATVGCF